MAAEKIMGPLHPGELLREEFLEPMSITAYRLAKDIGVSTNITSMRRHYLSRADVVAIPL